MKVILKQDIKGVGKKDEIINASDGYARNFLFPKNLAVEANAENMSKLKSKQDATAYKKGQEKEEAKKLADRLSKILLKVPVKAGENGKIFGGVSAKDISENLEKQHSIKIDKKKIDLKETIKTLGVHNVDVKLYEGVAGKIKVQDSGKFKILGTKETLDLIEELNKWSDVCGRLTHWYNDFLEGKMKF